MVVPGVGVRGMNVCGINVPGVDLLRVEVPVVKTFPVARTFTGGENRGVEAPATAVKSVNLSDDLATTIFICH